MWEIMKEVYIIQIVNQHTGKHVGYVTEESEALVWLKILEFSTRDLAQRFLQKQSNDLSEDYYYVVTQSFRV